MTHLITIAAITWYHIYDARDTDKQRQQKKEIANDFQSSSCHQSPSPNPFMDSKKGETTSRSHSAITHLLPWTIPDALGHTRVQQPAAMWGKKVMVPHRLGKDTSRLVVRKGKMETQLRKWEVNVQKQKYYTEKKEKKSKMIEKRQKQRMEPWGRVNRSLEAKKAPPTFFDSMALGRNTNRVVDGAPWYDCDDDGIMMVGLLFETVRLYGWEQIISHYCATVHWLLKHGLRSYRLQTTWIRNVGGRGCLHWRWRLVIMRRALMVTPGHYCSLTSSDRVNEESTSVRRRRRLSHIIRTVRFLWTLAQACPTPDFSTTTLST